MSASPDRDAPLAAIFGRNRQLLRRAAGPVFGGSNPPLGVCERPSRCGVGGRPTILSRIINPHRRGSVINANTRRREVIAKCTAKARYRWRDAVRRRGSAKYPQRRNDWRQKYRAGGRDSVKRTCMPDDQAGGFTRQARGLGKCLGRSRQQRNADYGNQAGRECSTNHYAYSCLLT